MRTHRGSVACRSLIEFPDSPAAGARLVTRPSCEASPPQAFRRIEVSPSQKKYNAVMEALNALFSEQSVSQKETKNMLEDIQGEIDILIDSLDSKNDE
jgi:hypothetical protein